MAVTESDLDPTVHNFLMTVRNMNWACHLVAEMLLILKKLFSTWLFEGKS